MDIYNNIDDCKKAQTTYFDYNKYKQYYNVIDSWDEIVEKIIHTYTKPIKFYTNNIDDSAYAFLNLLKPNFYRQSKEAVRNSLYYMYHKYGMCYYARIRDNSLVLFCYIWNNQFENYLDKYLQIDPKYASRYQNQNKKKWRINGAMIRVYEKHYTGYAMDFYYSEIKYLLIKLCEQHKISDCDFVIFGKDTLAIKKDLTEASEEVVGNIQFKLPDLLKFNTYCPIFSFNWNARYADIPLPTPDDVLRIFDVCVPPKCQKLYQNLPIIPWSEKIPTAVFRGSFTGASAVLLKNPRLHVAYLNNKWKYNSKYNEKNTIDGINFLNAGLSSKGGFMRGRKDINDRYIRFVDNNYWPHLLVEPLTHEQQSHYKYILYIEGNAAAYRGSYLFSFGSVVLWVKPSKYSLWFEPHLKDKINCIFIQNNLSNLASTIEWLKKNDKAAKKIADAGLDLYNTLLSKEAILEYTQIAINKICS